MLAGLSLLRVAPFLAIALLLAWAMRLEDRRDYWETTARSITLAIGDAAGVQGLSYKDAGRQAILLGQSRDSWKWASDQQGEAIKQLAADTQKLAKIAADRRKEFASAIARRDTAIKRLSNQAITPGDRANCAAQLREAEDVLDRLYDEGF